MTRNTKKILELKILREVFPKSKFKKYTSREKPDFILHGVMDFGIEIVEYYPDETIARLHNRPNYAEQVTNNSFIDKNDIGKLEIVTMEYQDPKTGKWKKINTPVVKQENKPVTDRLALLVKCIESKSEAFPTYDNNLSAIDLIVKDSRNTLLDGMNNYFVLGTLKKFQLMDRFKASGFRHIYIILPPSKGVPQRILRVK